MPQRFLKLLKGEDPPETFIPASQFTELDHRAFLLALFRLARAQGKVAIDGAFRRVRDVFHSALRFRPACSGRKEGHKGSLENALALVMLDEVENNENGAQRDRAILHEAPGTTIDKGWCGLRKSPHTLQIHPLKSFDNFSTIQIKRLKLPQRYQTGG